MAVHITHQMAAWPQHCYFFSIRIGWQFSKSLRSFFVIASFIFKSFLFSFISAVRKSQVAPSTHCLEVSSVKYLLAALANFPYYKTLVTRRQTQFSQVLCHFITRISFPPIPSNRFLISVWLLTRIAFKVSFMVIQTFSSTHLKILLVSIYYTVPKPLLHF